MESFMFSLRILWSVETWDVKDCHGQVEAARGKKLGTPRGSQGDLLGDLLGGFNQVAMFSNGMIDFYMFEIS